MTAPGNHQAGFAFNQRLTAPMRSTKDFRNDEQASSGDLRADSVRRIGDGGADRSLSICPRRV
jgi:hypothetical protein